MATFFEIFNKVLLELNYRTVSGFEDIYKSEHLKILDGINRVNEEVLNSFEWPFLLRKAVLRPKDAENTGAPGDTGENNPENPGTPGNEGENNSEKPENPENPETPGTTDVSNLENPDTADVQTQKQSQISTIGEILSSQNKEPALVSSNTKFCIPLAPKVKGVVKAVYQGTKRLLCFPKLEIALQKGLPPNSYAVLPDGCEAQILVNASPHKEFAVYYYSKDACLGADGQFKTKMDDGDDVSILPMPWAEHILLYGTCLKVKANPAYPKFGFWNTMYIQALANLQKKGTSAAEDAPYLVLA